jgi:hypothetical protein
MVTSRHQAVEPCGAEGVRFSGVYRRPEVVFAFESIGHGEETRRCSSSREWLIRIVLDERHSRTRFTRACTRRGDGARVFIGMETMPAARDIYPVRLSAGGGNSSKLPQLLSRLVRRANKPNQP